MNASVSVVTLKIDGKDVSGRADETILDLARENSIPIPTLCYLEGLSGWGALPPLPRRGQGREQAPAGLRDESG